MFDCLYFDRRSESGDNLGMEPLAMPATTLAKDDSHLSKLDVFLNTTIMQFRVVPSSAAVLFGSDTSVTISPGIGSTLLSLDGYSCSNMHLRRHIWSNCSNA